MKTKTVKEFSTALDKSCCQPLKTKQKLTLGFSKLDNLIGDSYLEKGNVICLSSRSGIGKGKLALDFVLNLCEKSKKEVIFFSSRQGAEEIADQLLKKLIGSISIRNPEWEDEKELIKSALKRLASIKLTVINFADGISKRIEKMLKRKRKISLIVIDDFGDLLSLDPNSLIKIRVLSKVYNIPFLLCGDLFFKNEKIKNRKPDLNDLGKNSVYFDLVLFLHRSAYYPTEPDTTDPNLTELLVAKNTFGVVDIVDLYFDYKNMRFLETKPKNFI